MAYLLTPVHPYSIRLGTEEQERPRMMLQKEQEL